MNYFSVKTNILCNDVKVRDFIIFLLINTSDISIHIRCLKLKIQVPHSQVIVYSNDIYFLLMFIKETFHIVENNSFK